MIDLDRQGDVFTMTLNAGENRWNTTFVRAIDAVLSEVEASTGPAALVTTSASEKFFSNGLDLDWVQDPDAHPAAGDRAALYFQPFPRRIPLKRSGLQYPKEL